MAEYICREELIEHLDKCRNDPLFDPDMARICFAIGIFIKNMEAADVKLIEHGKWEDCEIRGSLSQCCSICGCDSGVLYPYTYCPNCGARMDLEDGDTNG